MNTDLPGREGREGFAKDAKGLPKFEFEVPSAIETTQFQNRTENRFRSAFLTFSRPSRCFSAPRGGLPAPAF